ncbi:hypothetical protein [Microbulbifer sp. YPW1]|uniref:hypothetical protein n=1 Tax=Microbulbifer sp. YPW1 TaxID=2745199 RepID=UPI00159AD377|nr:hypothetical protein [Microbulbifer sp. YPW1]QKX18339.1 hypothetical protein HUW35_15985 [Microbulbifer sp. YPW1]
MRITLVKKVLADGSLCAKCNDVEQKLKENDQEKFLDEILIADERDLESPGMQLAQRLNVQRAPFFVVEEEGKEPEVYTVYFKFVKEVLNNR